MARKDKSTKEPGRLKQMWQVFQMTRRYDDRAVLYIGLGFILPILAGVTLAVFLSGGNVFTMVLWTVAGVLAGVLIALIVLGRRAERAAYSQIEGQPGAVGAVLRSSLKRSWRGSEMPVAVNGKTQDAVYRATGRGGVVLISEGPRSRTQRMVDEERRKVTRVLPNVPVTTIVVGPDADAVPLHKIPRTLSKIKPTLTKAEVLAISNRLQSLEGSMPIPKGIDPLKVRAQRAR
ncbi:hypothetical protein ATY41_01625 [Leifsonia xyli subsp. xyli]|uniref:Integral membrane protein n=2 Tax=Leifsonia xyli subsp. xyli TaxID=59736 RepID=Q6AFG8_LEIXX|nr:DUF4191 domain-containing protein [Leifsonia xyli]AAT88877.1 integral membrane protein [Leifsonia xyli subsp. xyli str. CTCB07]ODA90363.1 hypothetical protein ATY41_01625 [Leifsonia xyli subsp. xyli]